MENLIVTEEVKLSGTAVHRLRSEIIGQDYLVNVGVPPFYDPGGEAYPVVVITDGGPGFSAIHSVAPLMQMAGELTPFITVGISYDIKVPMHAMALRNRDLTQSKNTSLTSGDDDQEVEMPDWYKNLPKVEAGGASNFLDFINDQVKPLIQENYHSADDYTYAGYSLGGLFGLFALFNSPTSFQRYVIGSPSIWWDDKDILSHERSFAKNNDDLKATVYMSSGSLEEPADVPDKPAMVTNMLNLAGTLSDRNFKNLRLTHQVLEDETHMSGHPLALLRGIRNVFA
jgi:predicted alpha/beta superfamily hydrolase